MVTRAVEVATPDTESPVTVAQFDRSIEAHLSRARLESAGVRAFVVDEHLATINPLLSTIIPGEDDGKVAVERAKLAGMQDFLVLPVTHMLIMQDSEVIEQTLLFLADGQFDHKQDN